MPRNKKKNKQNKKNKQSVPRPLSSNVVTFQNNEVYNLQIDNGQTADKTVYIRPLSVRIGAGGFALFSSGYFTNVVSPAFGYYDVAECVELTVKFRPSVKRATNLYPPVQYASTRDTVLPTSTTSLSAFSDFQTHNPESEFTVSTSPSKDAKWLGTPHMLTSALLSTVGTSDYAIPRTLMFHIQYPENLSTALSYDMLYGEL